MSFHICTALAGKAYGDMHVAHSERKEWGARIGNAGEELLPEEVRTIFVLKTDWTLRLARMEDDIEECGMVHGRRIVCTKETADGGWITGTDVAVCICNADCPVVILKEGDNCLVLHAGYRSLVRENPLEPSLIEVAVKNFDSSLVQAFIAHGIGPCCWVPGDDETEVWMPEKARDGDLLAQCITVTTRGPGQAGRKTVDLYRLARLQLLRVGVSEDRIGVDATCTACFLRAGRHPYWSYTYACATKETDGRNACFVWLEEAEEKET